MFKTIVLALISITMGAVGQFLLKLGVTEVGGFSLGEKPIVSIFNILFQRYVFTGLILFVVSMFMWLTVISRFELSRAYPMMSLSYIIVTILSRCVLGEYIPMTRVAGIGVILIGVVLVNLK